MRVLSVPLANPRLRQLAFVVGLVALFAAVSVQYSVKIFRGRDGEQTRSAILRWHNQLQGLDSGENIYQRYAYPNPPIMALLLRPLAALPPLAGAMTWYYLKVALAGVAFALTFRLVETPERPFPPGAKALTVLLSLRPVLGDLSHGNVNILILFLVVLTLDLVRRGHDLGAGVVLALAVACKVTPLLFVPYFLWKRAWRVLAGCGLGLVLFLVVVPGLVLGWDQNLTLLGSWADQMVKPYVVGGVVTPEHNNQSLPGLLFRLLTHSPSFVTYVNDVYTPVEYHNVLNLDPAAVKWLVKGAMALFALSVVLVCRTPIQQRAGWRLAAEYAIVVVGMLLFSERTWKHHCVTLLVPFAVLCYHLTAVAATRAERWFVGGTLAAAAVLMSTTSTGLLPDDWAKLGQVYGAYVGAFVLLTAALAVILLRDASQKRC